MMAKKRLLAKLLNMDIMLSVYVKYKKIVYLLYFTYKCFCDCVSLARCVRLLKKGLPSPSIGPDSELHPAL